jgi:F0F1-type ATP synthase assembly protein I
MQNGRKPNSRENPTHQRSPQLSGNAWSRVGLALLIPSVLLAGPLAGLLLGLLFQKLTGWGEWLLAVFILLGLAAGARETVGIIRRLD